MVRKILSGLVANWLVKEIWLSSIYVQKQGMQQELMSESEEIRCCLFQPHTSLVDA